MEKPAWDSLKNINSNSNLSSKLYTIRNLFNLKLREKEIIKIHFIKVFQTVNPLSLIGEKSTNSHFFCARYSTITTQIPALENSPENELDTYEPVTLMY